MMQDIRSQARLRQSASAGLGDTIETERLTLRACSLMDVDGVMSGLCDFNVARMMDGASLPFLREDALELLQSLPMRGDGGWTYALTLADDQVVGLVCIREQKSDHLLQYWLKRSHWGQGYMGEALDAVFDAFFRELPEAMLQADVYSDDVPALNLQQRLGFKTTGCREIFASIRSAMVLKIQMQLTKNSFRAAASFPQ